jgi:hypothetical protein
VQLCSSLEKFIIKCKCVVDWTHFSNFIVKRAEGRISKSRSGVVHGWRILRSPLNTVEDDKRSANSLFILHFQSRPSETEKYQDAPIGAHVQETDDSRQSASRRQPRH